MTVDILNTEQKNLLFDLIFEKSFIPSEKPILLSSGKFSDYYFDLKKVTGDPVGIQTISEIFYNQIKQIGGINSVGGLESCSIAISTGICMFSNLQNENNSISSFYVRKKPKSHGLSKWIEGTPTPLAVVVDDVVTTGESALDALRVLKDEGTDVKYLFTIVYRDTPESKEKFEKENNIKLTNLFYESEFIEKYKKNLIEA